MTGLSGLFLKYDSHPLLKCGVGQLSNCLSSSGVGRIFTPASMPFVASGPVPFKAHSSKTSVYLISGPIHFFAIHYVE